jgi:hypothetical protein
VTRPFSTEDLLPSERRFFSAMDGLGFGRFEDVRIESGEIILDPWPTIVRGVKFGTDSPAAPRTPSANFPLKQQVVEFFQYVRAVDKGEIRFLEVKHSIPFSMEIQHPIPFQEGGRHV